MPDDVPLATGWEPDAPEGDSLVRRAILAHARWIELSAAPAGRPWRRTERWCAHYVADKGMFANQAVLLQPLNERDAESVVGELSELFPPSVPCFLVSPWPTPDLRTFGFELLGHPPLMARLPGSLALPSGAAGHVEIREVAEAGSLSECERVLVEGFPLPELEPFEAGSVFHPELVGQGVRFWTAYADGRAVATAAGCIAAGVNLVEFVATLPGERRKGYGAAVTAAATLADPSLPAVLISSDDGRPVYERLGYVAIERWTAWLRTGS